MPWYRGTFGTTRAEYATPRYIQLYANYEQYKNSFLPRVIRDWNPLPPDLVHAASVDEFIACLQDVLLVTVNTMSLTILMTSLARDAHAQSWAGSPLQETNVTLSQWLYITS